MSNKGASIIRWTPEEVDHLVSFGVKVHTEKYPHRTEKAAGLRLALERARVPPAKSVPPQAAAIPATPTPRPVIVPKPVLPAGPPSAPPLVRVCLPISLRVLGRMLSAVGDEVPPGATVRQVGDELWIEAPQ